MAGRSNPDTNCGGRSWLPLCIALGVIAFLGATDAAIAEERLPDRAPVLLRQTQLLPPPKSAGSGLEPEVRIQVTIDQRGSVETVKVLDVKPDGELADVFREHTIAEIRRWRWAPAIEGGKPTPKTLEWTVKYQPLAGSEALGVSERPDFVRLTDIFARRDHLANLSTEKKKETLLRLAADAEKHLDRQHRRQFDSPRFVVVTDSKEERTAQILAHNLEIAMDTIHELHRPEIEPHPRSLKTLVYIYSTREAFLAAQQGVTMMVGAQATYYQPGLILYHLQLSSSDDVLSLLIHEATHAYSDQHLRRPGVGLPIWFEEGFAEYMGNSEIKKGHLIPGKTLKRKYVLNHFGSGASLRTTGAGWDLTRTRDALRRGTGPSLMEVAAANRSEFYGKDWPLYYGTSWLLVHFLRHGEESWQGQPFSRLVLYLAEGYSGADAIEAAYGQTLAELEPTFLEYIKKI